MAQRAFLLYVADGSAVICMGYKCVDLIRTELLFGGMGEIKHLSDLQVGSGEMSVGGCSCT